MLDLFVIFNYNLYKYLKKNLLYKLITYILYKSAYNNNKMYSTLNVQELNLIFKKNRLTTCSLSV